MKMLSSFTHHHFVQTLPCKTNGCDLAAGDHSEKQHNCKCDVALVQQFNQEEDNIE